MKIKKISIQSVFFMVRALIFFLVNRTKYKKLEFGAFVIKPLRLNGAEYISVLKGAIVQNSAWLFALKIDEHEPQLVIKEGCLIGDFNHIASVRKVIIGKNVLTANRVYISDNIHCYDDINTPIMQQPVVFKGEVVIGDGSWIGENVCIIGASIGKNCVIGSNSVVTNDIPDYCVAVGAPAKIIKKFNISANKWEKV